jgi:hypothetical protein
MILFACVVLTAGLILYIFHLPTVVAHADDKTRLAFLRERKEVVYENLRDLNFEYKAGKLPDADYTAMRGSLEDEAATILAEMEVLEQVSPAQTA